MNTNELIKLIESFYRGETSPSEELLLQNYFNSDRVAEELLDEKDVFLQFYESAPLAVPVTLKNKLESLIDELANEESRKKKPAIKKMVLWSSVAACVAIFLTASIYMNNISIAGDNDALAQKSEGGNRSQIIEADYIEAENAMRLISANFNKGMKQLDDMNENLVKTNEILNRTFKKN